MQRSFYYPDGKPKLKGDPSELWAEHFAYSVALGHVARHATDFAERAIARAEIAIAEDCKADCAKRRDFDLATATRIADAVRCGFRPFLSYRPWPVYAETAPDTSKLPAMKHRTPDAVFVPIWPTMRTRGLPGGMIG